MKRSLALQAALLALSLMACARPQPHGAVAAPAPSALPGTYELVTIDDHALPYAPVHERPADAPAPPLIVSSIFSVNADSTFQLSMTYRIQREGGQQDFERQFAGTYVHQGAGYQFAWVNAGVTPVTLRGDTLVLNNEGVLFAYRRQPETRP